MTTSLVDMAWRCEQAAPFRRAYCVDDRNRTFEVVRELARGTDLCDLALPSQEDYLGGNQLVVRGTVDPHCAEFIWPAGWQWHAALCLRRFHVIVVRIEFGNLPDPHTNIAVLDGARRRFERFEPHGHTFIHCPKQARTGRAFQQCVHEWVDAELGTAADFIGFVYAPMPDVNVQRHDHRVVPRVSSRRGGQGSVFDAGFCVLWSIAYALRRLNAPDTDQGALVRALPVDDLPWLRRLASRIETLSAGA